MNEPNDLIFLAHGVIPYHSIHKKEEIFEPTRTSYDKTSPRKVPVWTKAIHHKSNDDIFLRRTIVEKIGRKKHSTKKSYNCGKRFIANKSSSCF